MRTRTFAVILFSALLLPQFMVAQAPPNLMPFSADMQVSSTHGGSSSMQQMNGKVYVSREHMRMDMEGGPHGGVSIITNFATKTTDTLMPAQHMYMESTADQAMMARRPGMPSIKPITDPSNPCANQEGVTCKNLGTEEVNGRTCDHWQMTDKNGKVSNSWIDQKLHFPIKTTSADSSWELTNIKEGQPDASLFEIPAGYHKMDIGQMMQGMQGMQGMHPPQE